MRKGGQEETKALGRVANQCCNGSHGKTPLTQEHFNIGEEYKNRNTPFNSNISTELSETGFPLRPPPASPSTSEDKLPFTQAEDSRPSRDLWPTGPATAPVLRPEYAPTHRGPG